MISVVLSLLLSIGFATFCKWDIIDRDGSKITLDLSPLANQTLSMYSPWVTYKFSPCRDGLDYYSWFAMATEDQHNLNHNYFNYLAMWDQSYAPTYSKADSSFSFNYTNGMGCYGAQSPGIFRPSFVCDPVAQRHAFLAYFVEISPCNFRAKVMTRLACVNSTNPTTTAAPSNQCVFKSNDGATLNLTSAAGKTFVSKVPGQDTSFYVYTPCVNSLRCTDAMSMAYVEDNQSFMCKQSLAVWDNGVTQPQHSSALKVWQFEYRNGQQCQGIDSVTIVQWACDVSAEIPLLISAKQTEFCVFQFVINSTLAC